MKKPTTSQLKKKLDKVFSEYIRRKDAKNEMAKCVTCGKIDHWENLQNGHYIPRGHLATRYREDNCHVQCVGCNVFKKGNYTAYSLYMLNKYGKEHLEELERQKHVITKYYPYEEKIEYYQDKLKELDD